MDYYIEDTSPARRVRGRDKDCLDKDPFWAGKPEDVSVEVRCSSLECLHKMVRTPTSSNASNSNDLFCSTRCYADHLSNMDIKGNIVAASLRLLGRQGDAISKLENMDKIIVTVDEQGIRKCKMIMHSQAQAVEVNIDEKPNVDIKIKPKNAVTSPTPTHEIKPLLKNGPDEITEIINELRLERDEKD